MPKVIAFTELSCKRKMRVSVKISKALKESAFVALCFKVEALFFLQKLSECLKLAISLSFIKTDSQQSTNKFRGWKSVVCDITENDPIK